MTNEFTLYGVMDKSTGKLVSNLTNPRHKYWETGEKNDFGKECYKLHFSQFYEEDDENVVVGFVTANVTENMEEILYSQES